MTECHTNDVICISDDDGDVSARTPATIKHEVDDDEAAAIREFQLSTPESSPTRSASCGQLSAKRRADYVVDQNGVYGSPVASTAHGNGYETPVRAARKRRTNESLKPITPSSTVKSSMNASLVFDMVTTLSTNDPGVAIATLRSIVVLGKEYPSNLLYDELIDRILSIEAVAYPDAVSIYASLVFVFDKAAACSCDLTFPHLWEPLAVALQDVAVKPIDELWRRTLLVVQFYIYCLKKDFDMCRVRFSSSGEDSQWIDRTRLFALLHQSDTLATSSASKKGVKVKVYNNVILQAVGYGLQLCARVFDVSNSDQEAIKHFQLEAEDACMSIVRLIEMLYLCTDQVQNVLQRVQAGLMNMSRETRLKFSQVLQAPDLKVHVATSVIGLTNKSRSKEHEWLECNAIGRVLKGLEQVKSLGSPSNVMVTDGYSWSHFDHFKSLTPKDDFTKLFQDISCLVEELNERIADSKTR